MTELPSIRDLGMFDGPEAGVQIGDFNVRRQSENKIWVERGNGEGSEFSEAALEAHIAEFYNKHF
jgi:hypothetical protein